MNESLEELEIKLLFKKHIEGKKLRFRTEGTSEEYFIFLELNDKYTIKFRAIKDNESYLFVAEDLIENSGHTKNK